MTEIGDLQPNLDLSEAVSLDDARKLIPELEFKEDLTVALDLSRPYAIFGLESLIAARLSADTRDDGSHRRTFRDESTLVSLRQEYDKHYHTASKILIVSLGLGDIGVAHADLVMPANIVGKREKAIVASTTYSLKTRSLPRSTTKVDHLHKKLIDPKLKKNPYFVDTDQADPRAVGSWRDRGLGNAARAGRLGTRP